MLSCLFGPANQISPYSPHGHMLAPQEGAAGAGARDEHGPQLPGNTYGGVQQLTLAPPDGQRSPWPPIRTRRLDKGIFCFFFWNFLKIFLLVGLVFYSCPASSSGKYRQLLVGYPSACVGSPTFHTSRHTRAGSKKRGLSPSIC